MSKISELSDGGSLISSDYLIAVRSGGNVKVRMDQINVDQVDLGDNEFIRLGNSQDLTMVHTSTQSIINQAGIGDLLIQRAGATKLTINASGIDVTGSVTADGLTTSGNILLDGSGNPTVINKTSGAGNNPLYRLQADTNYWDLQGTFSNTDDELFFMYNGSTKMAITSAGNVGIGTSLPNFYTGQTALTINSTAVARLDLDVGDVLQGYLLSESGYINLSANGNGNILFGTPTERMRIDGTTGNVGIGNSIPSSFNGGANNLVVGSGSGAEGMTIYGGAESNIFFADGTVGSDAYIGRIEYSHSVNNMLFYVNNSNAMTIDASGNLLVGKTSVGSSSIGSELNPTGYVVTSCVSDFCGYFNRTTTDGGILQFRKDNATVGSINTEGNDLAIGNDDAGIQFINGGQVVRPFNVTTNARIDAQVDLGMANTRFKDLYLSGASLAGAGSATSPSISFSGDTNTGLYSGGADNISFATGGTARAFMSSTQFNMTGNGVFSGSISKGSGSFKIDHPLPEKTDTHHLVHSFVESPQADNIYRGKVNLVDGSATVNIDDAAGMTEGTYVLLNTNTQCFTSNESGWTAVKGSVSGNILTITAQESCSDTISWMVIGERHDQHMLDTEWTDENGKVIVEPLKESQGDAP